MQQRKVQSGFISIMLALLLPGMLVAVALAADTGYLFLQKSRLQQYANAAALSGAKSWLVLPAINCRQSLADAHRVVFEPVRISSFSCADAEVNTQLTMPYKPILLGYVGFSSEGLVASARAGIKRFSDDSVQIVLLSGGA